MFKLVHLLKLKRGFQLMQAIVLADMFDCSCVGNYKATGRTMQSLTSSYHRLGACSNVTDFEGGRGERLKN